MTSADKVLEEAQRFYEKLPELLVELQGKWVVFLDGEVRSVHDDENSAYEVATATFGPEIAFVIAQVVDVDHASAT